MSNSCDPMDCSLTGSSVHGIYQARILEWIAISFSRGSSRPRNWNQVSCIASRFFTNWAMREALYSVIQLCPTLCNSIDCSSLGSPVHGIFPARILEWTAISSSRGIFLTQGLNPYLLHLLHWQVDSFSLSHLGIPKFIVAVVQLPSHVWLFEIPWTAAY